MLRTVGEEGLRLLAEAEEGHNRKAVGLMEGGAFRLFVPAGLGGQSVASPCAAAGRGWRSVPSPRDAAASGRGGRQSLPMVVSLNRVTRK